MENTKIKPEPAATPAKSFFKDAKVNEAYSSALGIDKAITVPGVYSGPLSGISVEVAEALIKMGDNQVVKK